MGNEEQKFNEDESVSRLLGGLKRIEAPNDFDFRLRARIAEGKPEGKTAPWLPAAVRYAVPLVLLLLVGGYFAFNYYSNKNVGVPAVVEIGPVASTPIPAPPSNETVVLPANNTDQRAEVKPFSTGTKAINTEPKKANSAPAPKAEGPGGGSIDQAGNAVNSIYPRGFDPTPKKSPDTKPFDRDPEIPVSDILTLIGIKPIFTRSGWRAEAIAAHSMAESSGIKAGDVIEAINDQPLTEKTVFGNKFDGKSLRVRRDGKSIQIELNR